MLEQMEDNQLRDMILALAETQLDAGECTILAQKIKEMNYRQLIAQKEEITVA